MYLQENRFGPLQGPAQCGAPRHGISMRRMLTCVPSASEWNLNLPDWFQHKTAKSISTDLLTSSLRTTIDTELPGGAPGCGDPAPPGIPSVMSVPDTILPIHHLPIHQEVSPITQALSNTWSK